MEALTLDDRAPTGCRWFPIAGNGSRFVDPFEDNHAITRAIGEINSYPGYIAKRPFAQPGWMEELFEWVQTQINPLSLRVTRTIRQFNASPTFSLIRLETTSGAVWFKATGEPNLHELSISVSLARLFPGYVPRVLGVHRAWNGWLSEDASGTLLDDCQESSSWERAAQTLAELQLASMEKSAELLGNHCKDLRLPKVVEFVDPFLARMTDFMAAQVKRPPEPLTNATVTLLGRRLREACAALQKLRLPDTLGHIDFNPGNIVVSPKRCCFLDWAEGSVSHPFVTFEYLREHSRRNFRGDEAAIERITTAYLEPWRSIFSTDTLRQAMDLAPLIAVFVAAVVDTSWCSIDPRRDGGIAGYFRSLTRRMFREASEVAPRSEQCLN